MSDNPEEKEFKLKGVIPAKVTTAKEFRESLENLREYHRRSPESLADIFEKHPSFLEEIKRNERRMQIASEVLASFANYFEKHSSFLEEVMKASEQKLSKEKSSSDCRDKLCS
jgi:DNA repair exonuclease SbcCD ATPase subunit